MSKGNKGKQLDKKGKETLAAIVTSPTLTAAAAKLGVARKTLYERIERYELRDIQKQLSDSTMKKLMVAADKAADVMIEGLEDRRVRYDVADKILNGVIFKNKDTIGVEMKEGDKTTRIIVTRGE